MDATCKKRCCGRSALREISGPRHESMRLTLIARVSHKMLET